MTLNCPWYTCQICPWYICLNCPYVYVLTVLGTYVYVYTVHGSSQNCPWYVCQIFPGEYCESFSRRLMERKFPFKQTLKKIVTDEGEIKTEKRRNENVN